MQRLRRIFNLGLWLIVFFVLAGSSVYAQQIPHFIKYQGDGKKILKEIEKKGKDKDKEKRLYTLTFRIYNLETGGVALWEEIHPDVPVRKRVFGVLLGRFTPLDLKFDEDYWLSIEIDGKGEMAPRERMTSFGYAYMSEDSYKLGGRYPDDFALFGHSHVGEDVVSPVAEAINADTVDGLHADQIGGIRDHGLLEGLADDDHLQYLSNLRGDERYAGGGWDGLTKLKTAQDHIVDRNNPHAVTLEQLGHLDNNSEEEAPTLTERGEPTGTEIQGWADDIMSWGHSNLVTNLNADMVDGLHATGSSNPLPNTLLALGADGRFPASVIPPSLSTGLWSDAGPYIYPNNVGDGFKITDIGDIIMNGNVGIGTISPVRKLHVVGFTNRGEHEPLVRIESSDGQALLELHAAEGSNEDAEIDLKSAYPVADQKIWNLHSGLNGGFSIRRFSDVGHNLLAMPFFISPEGRVGIGTINPQFGLDINGATFTDVTTSHRARIYDDTPRSQVGYTCGLSDWSHSGDFSYFGAGHDSGSGSELLTGDSVVLSSATNVANGIRIIAANNGTHSAPIIFATGQWYAAAAERMRITSSGNVGIGTPAPIAALDVNSGTNRGIRVNGDSGYPHLMFANGGTDKWTQYTNGNDLVFLEYNGYHANRVIFKSGGNVGIGTTDPQGTLDVNGAIYQRGAQLHADYVFEPDYKLESIDEHAKFMWQEKHLKAVPKAAKVEDGQEIVEIGARGKGVLEELEKAHIYIAQLNERVKQLEAKLEGQKVDSR